MQLNMRMKEQRVVWNLENVTIDLLLSQVYSLRDNLILRNFPPFVQYVVRVTAGK